MRQCILVVTSAILMNLASTVPAMDEGRDAEGNKPIAAEPFEHWPGVMPVINDNHRVYYYQWGRGKAGFHFKGSTGDLNAALKNYAKIDADSLDVVLRPGPGFAESFRDKEIACNWSLRLPNKWVLEMDPSNAGHLVWDDRPVLSIFVGGDIQLADLEIPRDVHVIQLADLQARYRRAVRPEMPYHIVSAAADNISELDPYNPAAMYRVAKLLKHDKLAVRNHASRAIARFGATAKPAIKQLRAAAEIERFPEPLATTSIKAIENAKVDPEAERKHKATVKEIELFVARLPAENKP